MARNTAAGAPVDRTVLLSRRAWRGQQSVEYHAIREVHDTPPLGHDVVIHRLQIAIDADSYDVQSGARIQRWDGQTWQTVATIPYTLMESTKVEPNYNRLWNRDGGGLSPDGEAAIYADEAELVRLAALVLGF